MLKDLMFSAWSGEEDGSSSSAAGEEGAAGGSTEAPAGGREGGNACREARADVLKMLALVDFYLPFLPLERDHIQRCALRPSLAPLMGWPSCGTIASASSHAALSAVCFGMLEAHGADLQGADCLRR